MTKHILKFLGVFALVMTTAFAPISLAQTAFAASNQANSAATGAATNDPISYTVQPGDNLSTIAQTYNTTVDAILALNPQITDPSLIYPGEVLLIPVGTVTNPIIPITGSGPSALISPTSGPQGTYIQVVVTGFPANTPIQIGLHKLGRSLIESTANATTDAYGSASVTMRIPTGANTNIGLVWLAQVSTTSGENVTVNSNEFTISTSVGSTVSGTTFNYVVQSGDSLSTIAARYGTSIAAIEALNPQVASQGYIYAGETLVIPTGAVTNPVIPITGSGTISYTVQSGDNLSTIAQTYNTTVSAIQALNPQITNPSLIYPGEVLLIPVGTVTNPVIPITGAGPSALISPSSGPQGTYVKVLVNGFPANTSITIGLHKLGRSLIESSAHTTTDAYGSATVTMQIPAGNNANNGLVWLAQVYTTSGESVTVNSNEFTVTTTTTTTGNTFTYIVQSGDSLSSIAARYGTSIAAIESLNPQVVSQGYIYAGEALIIPVGTVTNSVIPITGSGPSAIISPSSGPQGAYVQVVVSGFPANTPITIGLHKLDRKLIESTATPTTDANGNATVTMQIPKGANANIGVMWLAQVSTSDGDITINSTGFTITSK